MIHQSLNHLLSFRCLIYFHHLNSVKNHHLLNSHLEFLKNYDCITSYYSSFNIQNSFNRHNYSSITFIFDFIFDYCLIFDYLYHCGNIVDLFSYSNLYFNRCYFIISHYLKLDRYHLLAFYHASLLMDFFGSSFDNYLSSKLYFIQLKLPKEEAFIFQSYYSIFSFINFDNFIN